jgi:Xaa-Pro aminopeptidase
MLTVGDIIKKRGDAPVLFHTPMERGEAARTGLPLSSYAETPLDRYVKESGGDRAEAYARRYQEMLARLGIERGRVLVYGREETGRTWTIFNQLQKRLPGLELVGETENTVLMEAMSTKDTAEVERIRRMGRITTEVLARAARFLKSLQREEDHFTGQDGKAVTIGEVKRRISLWLAELGAENPEGTIFAQGRDAGIPHSTGQDNAPLRPGLPIIFDIFPQEAGGGYFYDCTRTWCLGIATPEAEKLFKDVRAVYTHIQEAIQPGMRMGELQELANQLFEERGHPTERTHPGTKQGSVHLLGHGVGLYIHEGPIIGHSAWPEAVVKPGMVLAIEPGLYYPDQELGVRLEDTFYVHADGRLEPLAEYPLDLVL